MPVNPIPNFIVKIYPGKTKVTVKPGPVTITNHYGDIWANITGKPTTFPPSAHRHPASEIDGLSVIVGPKGDKGEKGDTGERGLPGVDGVIGVNGAPGAKGDKGDTGSQGLPGERGLQGVQGDIGPQGIQGVQGVQGEKGDTGSTGSQGLQGVPGLKGDTGEKGDKGDTGERGLQGIQGIQGVKGDKGDTGNDGVSITGPQGIQGIQGVQGDTGPAGATGLQGIQGVKGDTGERGLQGLQGIQGETGLQGLKGDKGDTGLTGLKGDKGDTGERGLQGEQGLQGERGLQGLPGNNGTDGLKGDKGDTGERGLQGEQGIQGIAGNNGTTGLKGDKGDTGERGLQGEQGLQGIQGVKGDTGETGPQGPAGNSTGGGTADYVAWANVTGKPTTFAPTAHGHVISAITGLQTALDAKISTTTADGKYSLLTHQHQWTEILSKPSTFLPSNHTHNTTDITGISNYMLTSTATSSFKPISYAPAWTDILYKPSVFPPDTHTHEYSAISNKPTSFQPISAYGGYLGGVRIPYNGNITIDSYGNINANIPSGLLTTTDADSKYVIANTPTSGMPFIRRSSQYGGPACMTLNSFGTLFTQVSGTLGSGALTSIQQTAYDCKLEGIQNWYDTSILTLGKALSTFALIGSGSGGGNATVTWTTLSGKPSTFTPPIATASVLGGVMVGAGLTVDSYGTLSATPNWANITGKPTTFTPPVANLTVLGGIKPGYGVTVSSDGTLDVTVSGGNGTGSTSIAWANITSKPTSFTPPIATTSLLGGVIPSGNITVNGSGQIDVAIPSSVTWSTLSGKPSTFEPTIATASTIGGVKPGTGLAVALDGTLNCTITGSSGAVQTTATGSALEILDRSGPNLYYSMTYSDTTGVTQLLDDGDFLTKLTLGPRSLTATGINNWQDSSLLTRSYGDGRYMPISGSVGTVSVDWANITGKPTIFVPGNSTSLVDSLFDTSNGFEYALPTALGGPATGGIGVTTNSSGGVGLSARSNADNRNATVLEVSPTQWNSAVKGDIGANVSYLALTKNDLTYVQSAGVKSWGDNSLLTRSYADGRYPSKTDANSTYLPLGNWTNTTLSASTNLQRSFGAVGTSYTGAIGVGTTTGQVRIITKNNTGDGTSQLTVTATSVTTTVTSSTGNAALSSVSSAAFTAQVVSSGLTRSNFRVSQDSLYHKFDSVSLPVAANGTGTVSLEFFPEGTFRVTDPYGNGFKYDPTSKSLQVHETGADPVPVDKSYITRKYADTRYLAIANLTYANLPDKPTSYSLPTANDTVLGGIKVGANLTIANGVLSAIGGAATANLPWANITSTPTTLAGYGITDGLTSSAASTTYASISHTHSVADVTGLQTALDSKLSTANFTYANITGKPTLAAVATSGSYTDLSNTPSAYSLPVASASALGGVKLGTGVSVDANGFLSVSTSYAGLGANSFTGSQNLQDTELIRAKIRDYSETVSSPTISAGTLTLNLETSNIFTVSLNAAITTLTISNPPASGSGGSFTLIFTADGTARAVTWPASVKWAGGTAPTLTSTSGKVDSFAFFTSDGGTTWQGYIGGQNF